MVQPLSDEQKALAAGYVLGDLDSVETQQFEALLERNMALRSEVQALQAALRLTPQVLPLVTPPSRLKDKILSAHTAQSDSAATMVLEAPPSTTSLASPGTLLPSPSPRDPVLRPKAGLPWGKILTAILALGALWLGADNWRLRQALSIAQTDGQSETIASIMQRPNSRLVALQGNGTEAAGTLLFTPGQWQNVVVSLGDLPPLPPDQVYRMWLQLDNGDVIACGQFNTNDQGSVFVELNPAQNPPQGTKAKGIFVTIAPTTAPLTPEGERVLSGTI